MPSNLPGAGSLVKDAWQLFIATWAKTTKVSIWLVYFGLAQLAGLALLKLHSAFYVLLVPVQLAIVVGSVWVGIRLVKTALRAEDGKSVDEGDVERKQAWSFFWPVLLVGLLQVLIIFGASLLLVIPGIYFGLVLSFSQIILIDQDKRGFGALSASWEMVKGRWWAVLWRNLVAGVLFGLGVGLIMTLMLLIFAVILTPGKLNALMQAQNPDPLFEGAYGLVTAVVQAAVLPLFILYQAKLYRALQRNKQTSS